MFKTEHSHKIRAWLLAIAIIFFSLLPLGFLAATYHDWHYRERAFPGLRLGGSEVGGQDADQLKELVRGKAASLERDGITVSHGTRSVVLYPEVASTETEPAYVLFDLDPERTVETIMAYGRSGSLAKRLSERFKAYFLGQTIEPSYAINQAETKKFLKNNFSDLEQPGQDAQLVFTSGSSGQESFSVSPEKAGRAFDYDKAITQLTFHLAWLDSSPIDLAAIEDKPTIRKQEISNADSLANGFLELAPLTLKSASSSWTVGRSEIGRWLELRRAANPNAGSAIIIGLKRQAAEQYLNRVIAPEIDQTPAEAKFQIVNGRVTAFQTGKDGRELDRPASLDAIENGFIDQRLKEIELPVRTVATETGTSSTDTLGVTEIIGTGHSNFAGSPSNRRHNIRTGAKALSGLLIKPGETFSVIKNLGRIDASTGYLPELVIKGNKTTPEYGGGLCQVGTTMFRAALDSGLPIAERRNHSYRVSYYEPAGTDATIYDPAPDLKFTNDTGSYVLIQSRIEGNNLYFDFWGTSDGRVATRTYPTIYNIVKPKATKIIETTDLKPGQRKCTEKAHNGADAYFDYSVIYPNGETKKKRFSSHYVPWQEVCLVGVAKASATSTPATAASSTPSSAATTTQAGPQP